MASGTDGDARSGKRTPKGGNPVDKQFRALMEGLRTTLPGVQVLFGFLLALPFQSGFALTQGEGVVYAVAFISSAVASVLLIAPSAHQRVRGLVAGIPRRHQSHLVIAVRLTVVGTGAFLVAIVSSVYLVMSVRFGSPEASLATAAVAGLAAWTWFYMPWVSFRSSPGEDAGEMGPQER